MPKNSSCINLFPAETISPFSDSHLSNPQRQHTTHSNICSILSFRKISQSVWVRRIWKEKRDRRLDENCEREEPGRGEQRRYERQTQRPAHSGNTKSKGRNSSIELLRIIAMFMILMHHFVVHNGYDVLNLPLGPERIFFQLVMAGGGKVGVVIFFSISAWFFLDREQTIKSNLKCVWIMERELLF